MANHNDPEDGSSTERDREIDDQFRALMEGLRTTIPGVMVLFSFLLVIPLQSSFADLAASNTMIYYVAFFCAATASILLIAPSVHQRMRAPITGIRRRSMRHVMVATKIAIAGTVLFMVAVTAVVFLVSSVVFSDTAAVVATVVVALVGVGTWFYLPLVNFMKD